jgi:hypothetical protein
MEEIEVPTEHLHEAMHESAHESGHRWITWVALSSALLAALAAVCALMAGHYANEAMVEEIQSANQWSYYQSKSIKAAVLNSKTDLLSSLGRKVSEVDVANTERYKKEMEEIKVTAEEKSENAGKYMHKHIIFSRGVTMFQIAIAIGAIAALTRRKAYWLVSLGAGVVGVVFLVQGWLA